MLADDGSAPPDSGPGATQVQEPDRGGARIEVRPVDAAHGVIVTVTGAIEVRDAATLDQRLHRELDRRLNVVVVDLSGVPSCNDAGLEVLSRFRQRAHTEGVALHLVHLGAPAARIWLAQAGLL